MVREAIAPLLGLPTPGDRAGQAPAAAPVGAKQPPPAVEALIREVISAVNAGDSTALTRVVAERFEQTDGPPVPQRVARLRQMHDRLGMLTPTAMWLDTDGAVNVAAGTAKEGAATFLFSVSAETLPKIRSIRVMVGG
jgi:hypothetical protein